MYLYIYIYIHIYLFIYIYTFRLAGGEGLACELLCIVHESEAMQDELFGPILPCAL